MTSKLPVLFLGATLAFAAGCYVETESGSYRGRGGSTSTTPAATSTSTGGTSGTAPTGTSNPASPLLVEVDTDQTMNVIPGDGVGVFVEYRQGGGWHLTWTCDTTKSKRACNFEVDVSSQSALTNPLMEGVSDKSLAVKDTGIQITTATGADLHGVTFQTAAGAVVTIEAKVDGMSDGSFLFFVQDGKVNGDFKGKLTNPAQFIGKKP